MGKYYKIFNYYLYFFLHEGYISKVFCFLVECARLASPKIRLSFGAPLTNLHLKQPGDLDEFIGHVNENMVQCVVKNQPSKFLGDVAT